MPAHDAEKYLSHAISSVLGQTLTDLELVVVDDASTDSTAAIVQTCDDKRVRYSRIERQAGPSGARNQALRLARAPYVAFLDADDVAYQDRFATQLAWMQSHAQTALLGAGYDVIDSNGDVLATEIRPNGTASIRLTMLFDNVIATSLAFAKKDALFEAGLFDEGDLVAQDFDMWSRMAVRFPIARIPDNLGAYRQHGDGHYHAHRAQAEAARDQIVCRGLRGCMGVEVSSGVARVLKSEPTWVDHSLDDLITALATLELIALGPLRTWGDSAEDRCAMLSIWLDKITAIVAKEPRLRREAVRVAERAFRSERPGDVWRIPTLRSALRLVLASGGRQQLQDALGFR